MKIRLDRFTKEYILSKISVDANDCWVWKGPLRKDGYAQIEINYKKVLFHRHAYSVLVGEIPPKMMVLHKCDVRKCCNPKHLFLGNQNDNMKDAASKGRMRSGRQKLTKEQVAEIRELADKGFSRAQTAKIYGVKASTISQIIHKAIWKD